MKIEYDAMQPRDSVWIRTIVDVNGGWSIMIGQVANVVTESVMLDDCSIFTYRLSKELKVSKSNGVICDADRIDTVYTLGS